MDEERFSFFFFSLLLLLFGCCYASSTMSATVHNHWAGCIITHAYGVSAIRKLFFVRECLKLAFTIYDFFSASFFQIRFYYTFLTQICVLRVGQCGTHMFRRRHFFLLPKNKLICIWFPFNILLKRLKEKLEEIFCADRFSHEIRIKLGMSHSKRPRRQSQSITSTT